MFHYTTIWCEIPNSKIVHLMVDCPQENQIFTGLVNFSTNDHKIHSHLIKSILQSQLHLQPYPHKV